EEASGEGREGGEGHEGGESSFIAFVSFVAFVLSDAFAIGERCSCRAESRIFETDTADQEVCPLFVPRGFGKRGQRAVVAAVGSGQGAGGTQEGRLHAAAVCAPRRHKGGTQNRRARADGRRAAARGEVPGVLR